MAKTITIELTMPKRVYKRLQKIATQYDANTTDFIAYLLTMSAEGWGSDRHKRASAILEATDLASEHKTSKRANSGGPSNTTKGGK